MIHKQFQDWIAQIYKLITVHRQEAETVLSEGAPASISLATTEARVGEEESTPEPLPEERTIEAHVGEERRRPHDGCRHPNICLGPHACRSPHGCSGLHGWIPPKMPHNLSTKDKIIMGYI